MCFIYLTDFGGPIGELPTAPLLKGKLCFLDREAAVNLLSRWAKCIRKHVKTICFGDVGLDVGLYVGLGVGLMLD